MIRKDQLWAIVIKDFFTEMIHFFYPHQAGSLDFTQTAGLEEEYETLFPEHTWPTHTVSKLIQVQTWDGVPKWFLIHIIDQNELKTSLPSVLFRQFYQIQEKYHQSVELLVIYNDSDPNYHPRRYFHQGFKNQVCFDFCTYKLINQSVRRLSSNQNPFAIIMLIGLEALQQKGISDDELMVLKLKLFRKIISHGYSMTTLERLTSFLHVYLAFEKEEMNTVFLREIGDFTEAMDIDIIQSVFNEMTRITKPTLWGQG